MSSSELKLPKLHSWVHHTIDSIRFFGAINGYTTETYESLHKEYVKTPYRLSNKKDIEIQIMKTVSNNNVYKYIYIAVLKTHKFVGSTSINRKNELVK
jgi:hypothetical protein